MERTPVVFVVDDDPHMWKALSWLLDPVGLKVVGFASAAEFLERCDPNTPGCLILDVRMPGMSGLELQKQMVAWSIFLPIIFVSGHADVAVAVRAMQNGAFDFFEKPFDGQILLEKIQRAVDHDRQQRAERHQRELIRVRMSLLSEREREVMHLIVEGMANKLISDRLGITVRTVEAHRAKIMKKMHASSLLDLAQMLNTVPPPPISPSSAVSPTLEPLKHLTGD